MTGQSRSVEEILRNRLEITQAIAQANTEQMRLTQKGSGMKVLNMMDDRDGVSDSDHEAAQAQNDAALKRNLNTINRLEQQLSSLDEELADAVEKDS